MSFGIYVHVPFCLQRCHYCDFATYKFDETVSPETYFNSLTSELNLRKTFFTPQTLTSVYFGGGTPSLVDTKHLRLVLDQIQGIGFKIDRHTEVTIEINPATVDPKKLDEYLKMGVNRFSVGAQTFSDSHLKNLNREHRSDGTRKTLDLLKEYKLNYSFDLLYALPNQTLMELKKDLELVAEYQPPHISPYILTLKEGHFFNKNRPEEVLQVEMFDLIRHHLKSLDYEQYEISNFSKKGFHSKHNSLYWDDVSYWGVGLSSHSYQQKNIANNDWGTRFWNPSSMKAYLDSIEQIGAISSPRLLPAEQFEALQKHESLTDFCHTQLRKSSGLSLNQIETQFGSAARQRVRQELDIWHKRNLLESEGDHMRLTESGQVLSNQVFEAVTFLDAP